MKSILSTLTLICLSLSAQATAYSFSGTTGNWNVAANWTPAAIPVAGDDVTIPSGKAVTVPAGYSAASKSVTLTGNGSLTVNATGVLSISNSSASANGIYLNGAGSALTNSGTINISISGGLYCGIVVNSATATLANSGILSITNGVNGGIIQFTGTTSNTGTINIDNITVYDGLQVNGGSFTNSGIIKLGNNGAIKESGIWMIGGTFTNNATLEINNIPNVAAGYDAITANGGTFTNSSTGTITIGAISPVKNGVGNDGGTGVFNNSGIINFGSVSLDGIESGMTVNGGPGSNLNVGAGAVVKLAGAFSNKGTITTNATGTFVVNGTLTNHPAGIVTHNGTLKGSGTINQNGTFNNLAGSHIAPGNSPGTLTINGDFNLGSATLDVEINGATTALYDRLVVSGTATLTNASLNTIVDPGYTPGNSDVITIINAGTIAGSFASTQTTGLRTRNNFPSAGQFSIGTSVALPIKLLSFTATCTGNRNRITWNTATEQGTYRFEVERSFNGNEFKTIGKVDGNNRPSEYAFYDEQPLAGVNYYRLKITDANGENTYSSIAIVRSTANSGSVTVAPVPADRIIHVTNTDSALVGGKMTIYNIQGMIVYLGTMTSDQRIDISSWSAGSYALHLPNGEVLRIVKN